MSKKSIQELAEKFILYKDNTSLSRLIDRLKPGLRKYSFDFVQDPELCDEIVSQTFINVWEKIDQYNSEYSFSTWVYAIAKNVALGIIRYNNQHLSLNQSIDRGTGYKDKACEKLYHGMIKKERVDNNLIYTIDFEINNQPSNKNESIDHLCEHVKEEINNLEEPYKTVIYEREVNNLQLLDIAQKLNWNLSTVKTRLSKARKDVSHNLKNKYPELIELYYEIEN